MTYLERMGAAALAARALRDARTIEEEADTLRRTDPKGDIAREVAYHVRDDAHFVLEQIQQGRKPDA